MRRIALSALVLAAFGLPASAPAKFGISKTRITLPRTRPPQLQLVGDTIAVEAGSDARGVTNAQLDGVRDAVESGVLKSGVFRVVSDARGADNRVRVTVESLTARVRESVVYETKYVKTGERREWNDKKQRWETKDVWGNREEPVNVTRAEGRVEARVEVTNSLGTRSADAGESYNQEWKGSTTVPPEGGSEEALEQHLVDRAGHHAAAAVSFAADPVEVLLAVDGELKPGNDLFQSARLEEALASWSQLALKGGKEAARLHNTGVAHEALAYRLPMNDPQRRQHLEEAARLYQQARRLDPEEKYFVPPLERIEISLEATAAGERFWAELERSRAPKPAPIPKPSTAPPPPARPAPSPGRKPASAPATEQPGSAPSPLRNGSFEAGLPPWIVEGQGTIAVEPKRGKVLELAAAAGPATATQRIDQELSGPALLSLEYRVVSGAPRVRVKVTYDDAQGHQRTSNLEIAGSQGTLGWSAWETDLAALRPRPVRIRALSPWTEGGTARFDNLALTPKAP